MGAERVLHDHFTNVQGVERIAVSSGVDDESQLAPAKGSHDDLLTPGQEDPAPGLREHANDGADARPHADLAVPVPSQARHDSDCTKPARRAAKRDRPLVPVPNVLPVLATEADLYPPVEKLRRAEHAPNLRERHSEPDVPDPDVRPNLRVALTSSDG